MKNKNLTLVGKVASTGRSKILIGHKNAIHSALKMNTCKEKYCQNLIFQNLLFGETINGII